MQSDSSAPSYNCTGMDAKSGVYYYMIPSNNREYEMAEYHSTNFNRVFIWLNTTCSAINRHFQSIIYPNRWINFSSVHECERYLRHEKFSSDARTILVTTDTDIQPLLTHSYMSKISTVYVITDSRHDLVWWKPTYHNIRAVYPSLDSMYEQFRADLIADVRFRIWNYEEVQGSCRVKCS